MILADLHYFYPSIEDNHNHQKVICEHFEAKKCKENPQECEIKSHYCNETDSDKPQNCFVLWRQDNETGQVEISMKGCFTNNVECNQTECIDHSAKPADHGHNFCCCKGNMCNTKQKWDPKMEETTTEGLDKTELTNDTCEELIIGIVAIVFISLSGVGVLMYMKRWKMNRQGMFNEIPTIEPELSASSECLVRRPITLSEIKAHGRFGTVWRAQLKSEDVAVKVFPMQDKNSWLSETEIYKLPRMNHPNILHFIGAEKHVDFPRNEYWLITEYHPHGSLCDYLKSHTVTWSELCKIAETMARGLMHLHEEIPSSKSEGIKPAVAHRDFKSKNVLLKNDLTACIADFGLALIFTPGKPCGDTHGQVGTRRYMAPEILEGAINFTRDSFLRIDVYACGLALWELVSRCTAHGGPVSEYMLPFEPELGPHPSLEEMQEHIVTKKLRPAIYEEWRTHPGLSAICDTIEECWDHDAEARLSSSCIMERVSQHTKYQLNHVDTTTTNNILNKNNTDM